MRKAEKRLNHAKQASKNVHLSQQIHGCTKRTSKRTDQVIARTLREAGLTNW